MGFKQRLYAFKYLDFKYAFLELFLIIAGILIAFWIDTWWQNKQDLQRERSYLSALRTELRDNLEAYETHQKELGEDITITNSFISYLSPGQQPTPEADSIQTYLWSLKEINMIIPQRAALDDLINSGGMRFIQSDILRREIAGYEQIFQYDIEKQQTAVDRWSNSLMAFGMDHMNLSRIIPSEGIDGINEEEKITVPQIDYATDFSAFGRKEYINRLIQRILLVNRLRQSHQSVIRHIHKLISLIDIQLNPDRNTNTIQG